MSKTSKGFGQMALKETMPHLTVRLPREIAEALISESEAMRCSISETLRVIATRHVLREEENEPILRKLSLMHSLISELGLDLETVTRILLVGLKIATEEDAKAWCRENLMVGK